METKPQYPKGVTHPMSLYQKLKRSGNPQAAVQTVISLLESHSPKEVAKIMGISVRWVYKLRKRYLESNQNLQSCILKRGPKSPMPNRTPKHIEDIVVKLAKSTNLGPIRLAFNLKRSMGISLSPYTIRNILRRYGIRCRKIQTKNGSKRYYTDLNAFKPLQFFQFDTKHIADQKALPHTVYAAIFKNKLPLYQYTAIDVKTRLRFIAYAHSLSFINGLTFMLLIESWLRTFGVKHRLFFQTDNGEEFGGVSTSRKRKLMQSYIFDHLNTLLLNIPPAKKEANSYVERSHRTDDEEFYSVNINLDTDVQTFMILAQNWICYYNYQRPHFGSNMNGKTPMEALKCYKAIYHPAIGAMPVVNLDYLSLFIKDLFDISIIPWDTPYKKLPVNETMAQYNIEKIFL